MAKQIELKLDKWTDLIIALDENKSLSQVCYELKMTYSWAFNLLKEFEKRRWVNTTKKGRALKIMILPKGNKVFQLVKQLQIELEAN